MNRQGGDVGAQYRSIILCNSEKQKKAAEDFITDLQLDHPDPIVTEVKKLEKFYPAEDYHKDYFEKNPGKAYCQIVIAPKIAKIKKKFIL